MAVCAAAVEVHDIVISCLLCRVLHQPSPGPFLSWFHFTEHSYLMCRWTFILLVVSCHSAKHASAQLSATHRLIFNV